MGAAQSDPERPCKEECEVRVWDSSEGRLVCVWEGEDEILNSV